jgi:acyl-coenzyme A synthetase/AMP-(fatty) acid ligase
MNAVHAILHQARTRPEAIAIISDDGGELRFADVASGTGSIASMLAAQGLVEGDVVGTSMRSSPLNLLLQIALARLGAVSVTLHPALPRPERRSLARHFDVAAVVAENKKLVLKDRSLILIDPSWTEPARASKRPFKECEGGDQPMRFQLTSGTTGVPKAVVRPHSWPLELMRQQSPIKRITPDSRFLCRMDVNTSVTLHHCLHHLSVGSAVVFSTARNIGDVFEAIDRHHVTHAFVSPIMLERWVRALPDGQVRFPGITNLTVGGGRLREALQHEVFARVTPNVFINYGIVEAGSIAGADPEMLRQAPACAGRPYPWAEVQIIDENERPLPAGEQGIVRVRSPGVAPGYYRNPAATAKAFRDGWFYSSDIGRFTPDGILMIESRSDDLIILGGIKVNPARIEDVLSTHPEVMESAAFAAQSDAGRIVMMAAVVTRGTLDEQALIRYCRERLGVVTPERIFSLPELPRNAMGKVVRRKLAEHAVIKSPLERSE